MQNQLDLLLLSIPVEADGESLLLEGDGHVGDNLLEASCLGCKKQQQGHICPEDQLHWTEIPANLRQGGSLDAANNEHAKGQTGGELHSGKSKESGARGGGRDSP